MQSQTLNRPCSSAERDRAMFEGQVILRKYEEKKTHARRGRTNLSASGRNVGRSRTLPRLPCRAPDHYHLEATKTRQSHWKKPGIHFRAPTQGETARPTRRETPPPGNDAGRHSYSITNHHRHTPRMADPRMVMPHRNARKWTSSSLGNMATVDTIQDLEDTIPSRRVHGLDSSSTSL